MVALDVKLGSREGLGKGVPAQSREVQGMGEIKGIQCYRNVKRNGPITVQPKLRTVTKISKIMMQLILQLQFYLEKIGAISFWFHLN